MYTIDLTPIQDAKNKLKSIPDIDDVEFEGASFSFSVSGKHIRIDLHSAMTWSVNQITSEIDNITKKT